MKEKYYITTPIYYPSGKWHIGTCYTTVVCDALARFKRMCGYDVFYLTGTDEHGQKIEKVAKEHNVSPKEFVDKQVATLIDLWKILDISYDKFIRTTDKEHEECVQKIFTKLYEKGDIYKSEYEGWYCTPCESFWTKTQLVDGKCPDCGREVELTKESSYFFRLSKYQDRLIELIENNPEFLQPKSRQNEMLNNFLKAGLQDLAVSRTSFKWGIPVPFDPDHVIYVWVDALSNYITALGYLSEDDSLFKRYWPANVHMMGKEIVRFHSIIWPALLMALDVPVPEKVYGHGWLLLGSEKISKSKGNIIDPVVLSERYGVDAVRYYLLREVPFGSDGVFANGAFLGRINSDLCNNLGNLLSRTTAMVNQYFGGVLPLTREATPFDAELEDAINGLFDKVKDNMDKLLVPEALTEIFAVADRANKYIDETTPWILAKDETKKNILSGVLYHLIEALRVVGSILTAFIPATANKILADIGLGNITEFGDTLKYGIMKGGETVTKSDAIFKRININKELEEMEKIALELSEGKKEAAKNEPKAEEGKKVEEKMEEVKEIGIEDFAKIQLKVGKIIKAERVEKSKKLLHFEVDTGEKVRSIVSGVAKYYSPEEMLGKEVIVVANLKPANIGGFLSEGMILFGENSESVITVEPSRPLGAGSLVN
ncbi:methionine--tRNA ligase [bacterium]|nr:methionine--tRNA ligase [bacterium]